MGVEGAGNTMKYMVSRMHEGDWGDVRYAPRALGGAGVEGVGNTKGIGMGVEGAGNIIKYMVCGMHQGD